MTIHNAQASFVVASTLRARGRLRLPISAAIAVSSSLRANTKYKQLAEFHIPTSLRAATIFWQAARTKVAPKLSFITDTWIHSSVASAQMDAGIFLSVYATVRRAPRKIEVAGITKRALRETSDLIALMLDTLLDGFAYRGEPASELRRQVGIVKAGINKMIRANTLGTELLACFEQARIANGTIEDMERVRALLCTENPETNLAKLAKASGIVFCLVEECRIASVMTFRSRMDIEAVMLRMDTITDQIKLEVSDIDSLSYQYVVSLSAALVNHLSDTERQLPRLVSYAMADSLPSLSIAQLLYADASRSDELIDENKVIHPAFFPREIRALSE